MNWTTLSKLRSSTMFVFTAVLLIGGLSSSRAWGVDECSDEEKEEITAKCTPEIINNTELSKRGDARSKCNELKRNCGMNASSTSLTNSGADSDKASCRAQKAKLDEAQNKFTEKCANAGISMGCDKKLKPCEAGASEEYPRGDGFVNALGAAFGVSGQQAVNRCSSLTGREFKEAKKDIEQKLKDANKGLEENATKVADLNEEYNKAVAEIDKEVLENQKAYEAEQKKAGQDARAAKSQQEQTLIKARAAKRDLEAQKVDLNTKISALLIEKNKDLSELLEDTAVAVCFQRASSIAAPKKSHGSISSQANDGGAKANAQKITYTSCKAEFAQRRITVVDRYNTASAKLNIALQNLQSSMDDIDQQIASAQNEYDLYLKEQTASADSALKNLNKAIEASNKKRTALDQTTKQKGDNLTKAAELLKQEANLASNEMTQLGSAPPKSSGDVSVANAYQAKSQLDYLEAELSADCPEYTKEARAERAKQAKKAKANEAPGEGKH